MTYLCLETGVQHLSDLVIRRTTLAIRGLVTDTVLREIAMVAAQALGWSAARQRNELHACTMALRQHHGVRLALTPVPNFVSPQDALSTDPLAQSQY